MGDEADADWQDGLVEWGIEDAREHYRQALAKAVRTSPFRNRKPKKAAPSPHPSTMSRSSSGDQGDAA